MARKAAQRRGELEPLARDARARIEARFAQSSRLHACVPPGMPARELLDAPRIDAQRAPDVAQRRARAVADDGGGERRAIAPVFLVEVLDDLLAALVLEVDVDVGWLVALAADEALEEHARARGVDLGDAQAIADRRIRRRAAPLAQDAAAAREAHDVGHREEIRLVVQLGDQRELVLDLFEDLLRRAARIARRQAFEDERAQPARRRMPGRDDLLRILVAQLVERETAALGDSDAFVEQFARVQARQAQATPQVLFGVRRERVAERLQRHVQPDRGERVLQRLARANVAEHVADGHARHAHRVGDASRGFEQRRVVAAHEQRNAEPAAAVEAFAQEARLLQQAFGGRLGARSVDGDDRRGHQQCEAVIDACIEVVDEQPVRAFVGTHARVRDQLRQVAVAVARGGEQHETRLVAKGVVQRELGADDERQPGVACAQMRTHDAGKRTLVGDRQRRIAERLRALDQLFGMRGAAQEREVRDAVQFGVAGKHGAAVQD